MEPFESGVTLLRLTFRCTAGVLHRSSSVNSIKVRDSISISLDGEHVQVSPPLAMVFDSI